MLHVRKETAGSEDLAAGQMKYIKSDTACLTSILRLAATYLRIAIHASARRTPGVCEMFVVWPAGDSCVEVCIGFPIKTMTKQRISNQAENNA